MVARYLDTVIFLPHIVLAVAVVQVQLLTSLSSMSLRTGLVIIVEQIDPPTDSMVVISYQPLCDVVVVVQVLTGGVLQVYRPAIVLPYQAEHSCPLALPESSTLVTGDHHPGALLVTPQASQHLPSSRGGQVVQLSTGAVTDIALAT